MEELNQGQQERAGNYYQLFESNPVGQIVLKDLEDAFNGDLLDDNPFRMAAKVGARDVIQYIKERIAENVYIND